MFVFTWNPDWETGEPIIDMQHKRMVMQLELLSIALSDGRQDAETERTLLLLGDYIEYHFKAEELLMERYHYPDLLRHHAAHKELQSQVSSLVESYQRNPRATPPQVAEFLLSWMKSHFTTEDKEMAAFVKTVVP